MITIRSAARPLALLLLATALTACQSGPDSAPAASPSPTPSRVSTPSPTDELTRDEAEAMHPPAPVAVRAKVTSDTSVRITWQTPPAPTVTPRFSEKIVEYRIHRRGPGDVEMRQVGTSKTLEFVDKAPGSGTFAYVVTAVHQNDIESTASDPPAEVNL
ncbi:MAG: fibronectin type III domain-containing protein [Microlunatus sp.]